MIFIILAIFFPTAYISYWFPFNKQFIYPSPPENTSLDHFYIKDLTSKLAKVVDEAYNESAGEIAKGRAFGTIGEHYAAKRIIQPAMNDSLGSQNVTLEQIRSIKSKFHSGNLTDKLETLAQGLIVNNDNNSIQTDIIDCYISPRWNNTLIYLLRDKLGIYDKSMLTHYFNHSGLKVIPQPKLDWFDQNLSNIVGDLDNRLIGSEIHEYQTLHDYESMLILLLQEFEKTYNINFDNLKEIGFANESLPWYNETIANLRTDYVFIDVDPFFNPNVKLPLTVQSLKKLNPLMNMPLFFSKYKTYLQMMIFHADDRCKGLIYYDFNNDTYDMVNTQYMALPILFTNKTIGEKIVDDVKNFTIDYYIDQQYNESVISYNVIGEIIGKSSNKTIIVDGLYDSWWCQGAADSAVGMAIVLGIAKYFSDYNITPNYSVKFVAFGGEEYGFRGAYYYEAAHPDEDIITIIDMNQLGFDQTDPSLPLTLNIVTNKISLMDDLEEITSKTNYDKLTGTEVKVRYMSQGAPSNDRPFANNRSSLLWPAEGVETICFLKDTNWTRHHRDGLNHEEGDSLKYINWSDVNLTANMALDVAYGFIFRETPGVEVYMPFIITLIIILIVVFLVWRKEYLINTLMKYWK